MAQTVTYVQGNRLRVGDIIVGSAGGVSTVTAVSDLYLGEGCMTVRTEHGLLIIKGDAEYSIVSAEDAVLEPKGWEGTD